MIWISLDEADADDQILIANKLSDATYAQFGARLFGQGAPLAHAVTRLERSLDLLGPCLIAVSNAHFNAQACLLLKPLATRGSNVVLIVPPGHEVSLECASPHRVTTADAFALTIEEALEIGDGSIPPDDIERIHADVAGRFAAFASRISELSGDLPVLEPAPTGYSLAGSGVEELPLDLVLATLRRKGALIDAFEVCARQCPSRCRELVDEAGPQYAVAGLHDRLFSVLETLDTDVLEASEQLMRWYFAAATAKGEHRSVRPRIERYLSAHEAPELRALYASAFPDAQFVQQTARAVAALETPLTLRMHGFALGQFEHGTEGLEYLLRGLRLAEALSDADQIVAAATDICNFHIRRGNYGDAHEWIRWALLQYVSHNCQDEIRNLVAKSLLAYTGILSGHLIGLDTLVEEIDVPDEILGMPTIETAVSTLGDWCFINDRLGDALAHYKRNVDVMPRSQFPFFAVDVVPVLVRLDRHEEARQLGDRARALTATADTVSRALGLLASGLGQAELQPERARHDLEIAVSLLEGNLEAQRLAQASVSLAGLLARAGEAARALEVLRRGESGIRQLDFSGWRLCGGILSEAELRSLRRLYLKQDTDLEIEFLGQVMIRFRGKELEPSQRNAECLAALAASARGLTGEQLAVQLYGERAVSGTLKALVSRLRDQLPIESRPYRIGVPFTADFLELQEHLKRGRVRQALNLYKGPLLPGSDAPAVVELREHIDESLRQAVLASGDPEAMVELANRTDAGDLELLEAAFELVPRNDPQSPLLRARIRQVRRDWESEAGGGDVKPSRRDGRSSER